MAYAFMSLPTIEERVALGIDTKFPPDNAIVPFPPELAADRFEDWFMNGNCRAFTRFLNEGYKHTRTDLYHDAAGHRIAAALRLDHPEQGKQVLPLRSAKLIGGNPNFEIKAISPPRPIYALHLLAQSSALPVIITEGEKAAQAAQERFPCHIVTTWSGGAQAVGKADWRPLAGRNVTIWPDHDDAGVGAAEKLGALLVEVGAALVRVVQVPAYFPTKWDLADPLPVLQHG